VERDAQLINVTRDRRLGFAEYGDPAGRAVMSFHGGLSSRLDAAPLDEAARALGLRIISPDRPGIGLSDFQPGRTLLDWPNDVRALADALGIERFGAVGWSAGGPYVAACGFADPERITAGAMVASAVPFELAGNRHGLNLADRALLVLSERAPFLASTALRLTISRPSAGALERSVARSLLPVDVEAIRRVGPPEQAVAFMKESLRSGTLGVIRDYCVFGDPWGFDLEDVKIPVHVWQGADDTMCPPEDPVLLARHLADAELSIVPGEGHISLMRNHAEEILTPFVAAAG
jgi:pimeloyl-ACP methyl ester carboxylesterase